MKNFGFQNIILAVFIIAAIGALLIFSGLIDVGGRNDNSIQGSITVWGTIPFSTIQPYIDQVKTADLRVTYQAQDPLSYETDLVNALAAGRGPDLFIMEHEQLLRNKDKIFEIPYESFPRRDFTGQYIRQADILLTETGSLGVPLMTDPLVLYHNKGLLNSAFVIDVPEYWDEFITLAPQLTEGDSGGRIQTSAIPLGTYRNISEAKGILSTLFMQNGNNIVGVDEFTGQFQSTLASDEDRQVRIEEALEFYLSFNNFGNTNYTWNEALPEARDMFIAGDLGFYIGRSSEVEDIARKNPNLDFDVTLLPQLRDERLKSTFGSMTAIGISGQTQNIAGSIAVLSGLGGADVALPLSEALNQIPVRNDLLQNTPEDPYLNLFYNSAIISRGWVDPAPQLTDELFENLIRNINSGALSTSEAIQRSHVDLNTILDQTINTTIIDRNLRELDIVDVPS